MFVPGQSYHHFHIWDKHHQNLFCHNCKRNQKEGQIIALVKTYILAKLTFMEKFTFLQKITFLQRFAFMENLALPKLTLARCRGRSADLDSSSKLGRSARWNCSHLRTPEFYLSPKTLQTPGRNENNICGHLRKKIPQLHFIFPISLQTPDNYFLLNVCKHLKIIFSLQMLR